MFCMLILYPLLPYDAAFPQSSVKWQSNEALNTYIRFRKVISFAHAHAWFHADNALLKVREDMITEFRLGVLGSTG